MNKQSFRPRFLVQLRKAYAIFASLQPHFSLLNFAGHAQSMYCIQVFDTCTQKRWLHENAGDCFRISNITWPLCLLSLKFKLQLVRWKCMWRREFLCGASATLWQNSKPRTTRFIHDGKDLQMHHVLRVLKLVFFDIVPLIIKVDDKALITMVSTC